MVRQARPFHRQAFRRLLGNVCHGFMVGMDGDNLYTHPLPCTRRQDSSRRQHHYRQHSPCHPRRPSHPSRDASWYCPSSHDLSRPRHNQIQRKCLLNGQGLCRPNNRHQLHVEVSLRTSMAERGQGAVCMGLLGMMDKVTWRAENISYNGLAGLTCFLDN